MAYTVGSAKINIHPDLKGFREKLQDQWDREVKKFNEENKDNGPEVTPQLNKEGLKKSIAEANKAIRDDASISDIDVKGRVSIDTSEIDKANAKLAKAFKGVKQNSPEIQYTGNTDVQVDQIEKLNKGFKENIALLQKKVNLERRQDTQAKNFADQLGIVGAKDIHHKRMVRSYEVQSDALDDLAQRGRDAEEALSDARSSLEAFNRSAADRAYRAGKKDDRAKLLQGISQERVTLHENVTRRQEDVRVVRNLFDAQVKRLTKAIEDKDRSAEELAPLKRALDDFTNRLKNIDKSLKDWSKSATDHIDLMRRQSDPASPDYKGQKIAAQTFKGYDVDDRRGYGDRYLQREQGIPFITQIDERILDRLAQQDRAGLRAGAERSSAAQAARREQEIRREYERRTSTTTTTQHIIRESIDRYTTELEKENLDERRELIERELARLRHEDDVIENRKALASQPRYNGTAPLTSDQREFMRLAQQAQQGGAAVPAPQLANDGAWQHAQRARLQEIEIDKARKAQAGRPELEDLRIELGTVGDMAARAAARGAGLGIIGLAAMGAVPGVMALSAELANVGKLAAMLPAFINAGGAALATFLMATNGLVDKFGELNETIGDDGLPDMEAYNEALADASDNMRDLADSVFLVGDGAEQSLMQGLTGLQEAVQNSFLGPVSNAVETARERLMSLGGMDDLTAHFTKFGEDFGRIVENWSNFRFSDAGWDDLNRQMLNFSSMSDGIVNSLANWNHIWNDLATVGSDFLPRFGEGVDNLTGKLMEATSQARADGSLARMFVESIDSAQRLGTMIATSFGIISDVSRAAAEDTAKLTDEMNEGLAATREFTSSFEGQEKIGDFFGRVTSMGRQFFDVLKAAGGMIAEHLVPVLSEFSEGLGPKMVEYFERAGHMLDAIEPSARQAGSAFGEMMLGMQQFGMWLEPIVSNLLPPFVRILETLGPLLGALAGPLARLMILATLQKYVKAFADSLKLAASIGGGMFMTKLAAVLGITLTLAAAFEPFAKLLEGIANGFLAFNDALSGLPEKLLALSVAIAGIVKLKASGGLLVALGIKDAPAQVAKTSAAFGSLGAATTTTRTGLRKFGAESKTIFRAFMVDAQLAARTTAVNMGSINGTLAGAGAVMGATGKSMQNLGRAASVPLSKGLGLAKGAALGLSGMLGGPLGLALLAGGAGFMAYKAESDRAKEGLEAIKEQAKLTEGNFKSLHKVVQEGGDVYDAFADRASQMAENLTKLGETTGPSNWDRIGAINSEFWHGFVGSDSDAWQDYRAAEDFAKAQEKAGEIITDNMDKAKEAIAGGTTEWERFMDSLGDSDAADMARETFQRLADDLERALQIEAGKSDGLKEFEALMREISDAGADAEGNLRRARDAMMLFNGVSLSEGEAEAKLYEDVDRIADSYDRLAGATLRANGEIEVSESNGRYLRETMVNLGNSLLDLVEAGKSPEEAFGIIAPALEGIRGQVNMTDGQWKDMLSTFSLTPESFDIAIRLGGNAEVMTELGRVKTAIENTPEGEAVVKLGKITEDTQKFLQDMGHNLEIDEHGSFNIAVGDETKATAQYIDSLYSALGRMDEKTFNAVVKADGATTALDLVNAIAGTDIKDKSFDVSEIGSDEVLGILEDLGLIKIQGKRVHVSDVGGEAALELLASINSNSGDVTKNITITTRRVEIAEEYYGKGNDPSLMREARRRGLNADGGRLPKYSTGGKLPTTGPGTNTTDGIVGVDENGVPLSRVDAGEWIINSKSSEQYNNELAAINSGTFPKLPGYANGGRAALDAIVGIGQGFSRGAQRSVNKKAAPLNAAAGALGLAGDLATGGMFTAITDEWSEVEEQITAAWSNFTTTAQTTWTNLGSVISTPFTEMSNNLESTWTQTASLLTSDWDSFSSTALSTWSTVQGDVTSQFEQMQWNMTAQWTTAKDNIDSVYRTGIVPVFDALHGTLNQMVSGFNTTVSNISTAWDQVRGATARPARFVVESVFNNGIRNAWNAVADIIDGKEVAPVGHSLGGYATGGVLPGYTPGKDVHHFQSPTGGSLHLSGGEAVMRPEWTRAVGGPKAVEQMNAAARSGKMSKLAKEESKANGYRQAFAEGGIVQAMTRIVQRKYPMLTMTSGQAGRSGGLHGAGMAADFSNGSGNTPQQLALARDISKTYPNSAELIYDSPGWSGNIKNGQNVGAFGGFYNMAQAGPHHHHVHWGMNTAPTMPFGGGVFPGGSSGGGAGGAAMVSMADIAKEAWDEKINKIPDYKGGQGKFDLAVPKLRKNMESKVWEFIEKKAGEMDAISGAAGLVSSAGVNGTNKEMGKQMAARAGWTGGQWSSLDKLWTKESGWNNLAQNPTSTAYGIPQFLDTTWAEVGGTKTSDARKQIQYGIAYIKKRYGDANAAWGHSVANNWYKNGGVLPSLPSSLYDNGGYLQSGITQVMNKTGKPEPVFNPKQWKIIEKAIGFNLQASADRNTEKYEANRRAEAAAAAKEEAEKAERRKTQAEKDAELRAKGIDPDSEEYKEEQRKKEKAERKAEKDAEEPPVMTTRQWEALANKVLHHAQNGEWDQAQAQLNIAADKIAEAADKVDWIAAGEEIGETATDAFIDGQVNDALGVFGIPSYSSIPAYKAYDDATTSWEDQKKKEADARQKAAEEAAREKDEADREAKREADKKEREKEKKEREAERKKEKAEREQEKNKYATGGWISGPGSSTADIIPIMASAGEFMVKATVAGAAPTALTAMNSIPGVASTVESMFTSKSVNSNSNSNNNAGPTFNYTINATTVDEGMRRAEMHARQTAASYGTIR